MTDKSKDWASVQETAGDVDDFASVVQDDETASTVGSDVDAVAGVLEHPSYIALEAKLTETEQSLHASKQETLRAMAELENIRRRSERDVESAYKFGLEKFVDGLIPFFDSLEHAVTACDAATDVAAIKEGIELTAKLMQDILAKFNVAVINPVNELFDPNRHEAISMQIVAGAVPNSIIAVVQKGYSLNDRVIRPARVIIAKSDS